MSSGGFPFVPGSSPDTAWDYRFVYRELIALLRRDEQLQRRWVAIRTCGFEGFRELIDLFVSVGVLRAPTTQRW